MPIYQSDDGNHSADSEACYEIIASQEEIYLEEVEEELRLILESDDPAPPLDQTLDQQQENLAEELITGDSDDPPLSDESVEEMLTIVQIKEFHR